MQEPQTVERTTDGSTLLFMYHERCAIVPPMMTDTPMKKVITQNRDELYVLHPDTLAYLQAEGNYTKIVYICGLQLVITMGISKVEEALRTGIPEEDACQFLRLGRSLVVNRNLIHSINAATQKLTFFDGDKSYLTIPVAKSLLLNLKAELGN